MKRSLDALAVAVVIPCYNVSSHIAGVVGGIPPGVRHIIAVNDCSRDDTGQVLARLAEEHPRLHVVTHARNRGVGGATLSGFEKALELEADIVVKMDGDGQMDPNQLPKLLQPLLEGRAAYAKGNRFRKSSDFLAMPPLRKLGNVALTFLTRMASGYWHVFDPQNGYLAIDGTVLRQLPLQSIDHSYFFENSMLGHLCIESAPVVDVPMEAIYGQEKSSMSILKVAAVFPFKLLGMLVRRVLAKYFLYDVSPAALYLTVGVPSLLFGLAYGIYHWYVSLVEGKVAAAGTIALSGLAFLIGLDLLLQAFNLDVVSSPRPRPGRFEVSLGEIRDWLHATAPVRELEKV